MKNKFKDTIKKIFKGAGFITLSAVSISLIVRILGVELVIIAAGIVIAIPVTFVIGMKKLIPKFIEIHKLKKEYNNKLKEKEEYQKDYAVKRANSIQLAKDQNNKEVLAEEFVPLTQKELDILEKNDIVSIKTYKFIKEQISKETNKIKLEKLKQQLTKLSFQIQDIATTNNEFLNKYETPEEIYKKRNKIRSINQNKSKKLSMKFLKNFKN